MGVVYISEVYEWVWYTSQKFMYGYGIQGRSLCMGMVYKAEVYEWVWYTSQKFMNRCGIHLRGK